MVDPVIPSGYTVQRLPERRENIVARWKDAFGQDSDVAPNTHDGNLIDQIGAGAQACDEAGSLAYQAGFFTTATGLSLDSLIGGLFGTKRGQDTGSKGELLVYGEPGTVLITASEVSTRDAGVVYALDSSVQIEYSDTVVFVFGPASGSTFTILTLGPISYAPVSSVSGTGVEVAQHQRDSMPSSDAQIDTLYPVFEDPAGNGVLVVKMTSILNTGSAADASTLDEYRGSTVSATSVDPGDQPGEELSIINILTGGQTGWEGVTNLDEVTPGFLTDMDAEYRQRHLDTLGRNGSRTMPAVISILRDITKNPGVEYVEVYNNPAFVTVDGRPPKSYECVVEGGSDLTIASLIYTHGPEGIETFGSTLIFLNDDRRVAPFEIRFTRPTKKHVWMHVTITGGEGFPSTEITSLQTQVQNQLFDFGRTLGVGRDIYRDELKQFIQIRGVQTILIEMGTTPLSSDPQPGLSDADVSILEKELSIWDVGKISVEINV